MIWVLGALALLVVALAVMGFKIVPQAETMIVERLGRYNRTLASGVNVIWPVVERARAIEWRYVEELDDGRAIARRVVTTKIDLRETVYDFPRQTVITRDNVLTEINALVYFQITDPRRAVYEIANLPDAIEKLTQTTLRNVIGEMDLDETLSSRDTINSKLRIILDEATDKWGVKVNRVELQDINPPTDIRDAMEKQMRAERDRRAAILEAEGSKRSRILEAEGLREAQKSEAEGARQARILVAEGEAEARRLVADAEAEAIARITEALKASGGDPDQYLIAVRYIEALKEMV
ncbi:MAG TPA: stomatin-like protein [Longimicrobiales bacterium]|nr:stomatin-like protein [Longimicrobiales bacterium]